MTDEVVPEECVMALFTLLAEALFRAGDDDPLSSGTRLTARVVGLLGQHLQKHPRPSPNPSPN